MAARIPQINISLSTNVTSPGGGTSATDSNGVTASRIAALAAVPVSVQGGVAALVTLNPPARTASKTLSTTDSAAASQPVANVVLTYDPTCAGQLVWVQMLSGGTLTTVDSAGKTYDGSNGFSLTLDANATASFTYQAPNISGSYQVLTRLSNVVTTLPFLVPDAAP